MPRAATTSGSRLRQPAHRPRRVTPTTSQPAGLHAPRGRGRTSAGVEVGERGRGHERLRQPADASHQVRPTLRIELAEHVVEEQQGRVGRRSARQQVELGELPAPGSRCAAGRVRRTRRGPGRRARTPTSSRCGPTSVAPFHSSFSAVSASRRRSASSGVSSGGGSALRDGRAASADPRPARSPRGRPRAARRARRASSVRQRTMRPPSATTTLVPEAQLVAAGRLLADAPQQVVALGRAPGRRWPSLAAAVGASWATSVSRLVRRSDGEPTTSSMSSGAKTHGPECARERRRPARHAVDPDPLADAPGGAARADQHHLDRVPAARACRPRVPRDGRAARPR